MVVGHYATGLVAHKQYPQLPLWSCLVAAIFLDIVLGVLLVSGVEHMTPVNPDAPKLYEMAIDMTFSHDLLPVLIWTVLGATCGFALTRSWAGALWMGGLVIFHEVLDLVGGFYHYIYGSDTVRIGLGLYEIAPLVALAIEVVLCITCVWWFARETEIKRTRLYGLYTVMILGCVVILPMAT